MPARSLSFRSVGDVVEVEFHPAAKTAILSHHDVQELRRWLEQRDRDNFALTIEFDGHPNWTTNS